MGELLDGRKMSPEAPPERRETVTACGTSICPSPAASLSVTARRRGKSIPQRKYDREEGRFGGVDTFPRKHFRYAVYIILC